MQRQSSPAAALESWLRGALPAALLSLAFAAGARAGSVEVAPQPSRIVFPVQVTQALGIDAVSAGDLGTIGFQLVTGPTTTLGSGEDGVTRITFDDRVSGSGANFAVLRIPATETSIGTRARGLTIDLIEGPPSAIRIAGSDGTGKGGVELFATDPAGATLVFGDLSDPASALAPISTIRGTRQLPGLQGTLRLVLPKVLQIVDGGTVSSGPRVIEGIILPTRTAPIPEPASAALFLVGAAIVGCSVASRRSATWAPIDPDADRGDSPPRRSRLGSSAA